MGTPISESIVAQPTTTVQVHASGSVALHRASEAVASVIFPLKPYAECSERTREHFREIAEAAIRAFLEHVAPDPGLVMQDHLMAEKWPGSTAMKVEVR